LRTSQVNLDVRYVAPRHREVGHVDFWHSASGNGNGIANQWLLSVAIFAPASISVPAASPVRRGWLTIEFLLIFTGLPLVYRLGWIPLPMLPTLGLATIIAAIILWRDPSFDRGSLWRWPAASARHTRQTMLLFLLAATGLTIAVAVLLPERLFAFPRTRPGWWALVLGLYPWLSALPQELLYRSFCHHRYRPLFSSRTGLLLASAVAFAILHIVFRNWPAVVLTFLAGWRFADTYERTGSLPWVTLEHALYGNWIFTVGLGIFFYSRAAMGG